MDKHPVRTVVARQGRRLTWLAEQMAISPNYLHRILLGPEHKDGRVAPEWFYPKAAQLLGVPVEFITPAVEDVAENAAV